MIAMIFIFNGVKMRARDAERRSDLISLQSQIEVFFRGAGRYPSLAELNDPTFRAQNLPSVSNKMLQDPQWSPTDSSCRVGKTVLVEGSPSPSPNCYAYIESPPGCDGASCTGYILAARLESGIVYKVSHLH
jgi:hypothetical protein